ncbi:hypothetical protein Chor_001996 [Crotalus horridus]
MAGPLRGLRRLPALLCGPPWQAPPKPRPLLLLGSWEGWALETPQVRTLATKKAKVRRLDGVSRGDYVEQTAYLNGAPEAGPEEVLSNQRALVLLSTAKGKGQVRVNINTSLVEDIINLEEVNEEMNSVVKTLQENFNKTLSIRTNPGALDSITVTTKDGKFPLNQLAQISQHSAQLLVVNMSSFPESTAAAVKAIQQSGMNLNPEADGLLIRVPVPKITREHRENLVTVAKQLTHKAKESLRKIQQMTEDTTAEMEKLLAAKTKELLA